MNKRKRVASGQTNQYFLWKYVRTASIAAVKDVWFDGNEASVFVPNAVIKSGCAMYGRMRRSMKYPSKSLKNSSFIKRCRVIAIKTARRIIFLVFLLKIVAARIKAVRIDMKNKWRLIAKVKKSRIVPAPSLFMKIASCKSIS